MSLVEGIFRPSAVSSVCLSVWFVPFVSFIRHAPSAKRNITDEKAALRAALDKFENEGLQNGTLPFCSGNCHTPDLGDLAVFGVLYSVQELNAHTEAIQLRGGAVKTWYDRMHRQVLGREAKHRIKLGVCCK